MDSLQLSRSKVYDLLRSGDLRSLTIGRSRRIPAEEITAYMSKHIEEGA